MEDNGQKPRGSQQKAVLPAERLRAEYHASTKEMQTLLIKAPNPRHFLQNRLEVKQSSLSCTPLPSQQLACSNSQGAQRCAKVPVLEVNGVPIEEKTQQNLESTQKRQTYVLQKSIC